MENLKCLSKRVSKFFLQTFSNIEYFRQIVETSPERRTYYLKLNATIEKISQILHFGFVFITDIAVVAPFLIITIVNYTIYDQGDESFFLPFPTMYVFPCMYSTCYHALETISIFFHHFHSTNQSLPWNWEQPFGYVLALIIQAISTHCSLYCVTPVIAFMIGSCWLFGAFIEDIIRELDGLNDQIKSKKKPKNARNKMNKHFCKIVQLYSDVKQLRMIN